MNDSKDEEEKGKKEGNDEDGIEDECMKEEW